MQTLIFTGPAGTAALAAGATAATAAARGSRTLLASVGPSHALASLTGIPPGPEPRPVAAHLDAWCLDPLADLSGIWAALRGPSSQGPPIAPDELPIIPGSDLFLAVARLRQLAQGYDLVCVDAGPPDTLLRAMAVPDTFRWALRLLLGLDRGPGKSSASVARAVIPTGLIPFPMEWTGNLQDARVRLEQLRDETLDPARTRVRYVLRADSAALAEARLALPALQLFGLVVEDVVAGPLLDPDLTRVGLDDLLAEQRAVLEQAATIWPGRRLLGLPATATPAGADALAALGARLYGDQPLTPEASPGQPIRLSGPPTPGAAIDLPGLPREALGLTLSGDELIVRAGPYRRHLLLPEGLRGISAIKATRQGDTLLVQSRS